MTVDVVNKENKHQYVLYCAAHGSARKFKVDRGAKRDGFQYQVSVFEH